MTPEEQVADLAIAAAPEPTQTTRGAVAEVVGGVLETALEVATDCSEFAGNLVSGTVEVIGAVLGALGD